MIMDFVYLFLMTLAFVVVGGSIGYVVWLRTRPRKETYHARIYQLSDGIIQKLKTDEGELDLSKLNLQLRDMRPFCTDVVEKVEKEKGLTVYRLQRLNKPISAVDGDIEIWEPGKKEIYCLKIGDSYTQLKRAYNDKIGEMIFHPMPNSRINIIKNEMAIRKDRLHTTKDILQAISPWIVAGICMVAVFCIAYIEVSAQVKMSENSLKMADSLKISQARIDELTAKVDALTGIQKIQRVPPKLGEITNSSVIPMIEG